MQYPTTPQSGSATTAPAALAFRTLQEIAVEPAPKPRVSDEFRNGLLAAIPALRGFAFSLVGRSPDRADDLVQQTVLKAWSHHDSFEPGSNLNAWLHTILRNEFYSQIRKKSREVEDADGCYSGKRGVRPEQQSRLDLGDMEVALQQLSDEQREAILLVAVSEFTYEEAAAICGIAVGTIKSRVNRARTKLAEILQITDGSEYGADPVHSAAVVAIHA